MHDMTLRIPEQLRDEIKRSAEERGQTISGMIRQILYEWIKKTKKE